MVQNAFDDLLILDRADDPYSDLHIEQTKESTSLGPNIIPGIFRVAIEVIVIDFQSKCCITSVLSDLTSTGSNAPASYYDLIGAPFRLLNGRTGTVLRKLGFLLRRSHFLESTPFIAD
jgi:hypothetical protein